MDRIYMEGIIYIAYLKSGMCYIGQTILSLKKRERTHWYNRNDGKIFHVAMKYFGRKAFKWEILEICDEKDLNEREKFWIEYFESCDCGFNRNRGGDYRYDYRHRTEDTLKRMGRKGKVPWNKNKTGVYSEETLEKMRESSKKENLSEETRRLLSEAAKKQHRKRS